MRLDYSRHVGEVLLRFGPGSRHPETVGTPLRHETKINYFVNSGSVVPSGCVGASPLRCRRVRAENMGPCAAIKGANVSKPSGGSLVSSYMASMPPRMK